MQMWQMTERLRRLSKCGGITDGIWLRWRLVSGAYARIFNWIKQIAKKIAVIIKSQVL